MTEIDLALSEEINKKSLKAVMRYESELKNNSKPSIETYVNLAFLYWKFVKELPTGGDDIPPIPHELRMIGGDKYPKIIELGLQKYPRSVELHFWQKYFPYRHYYDEFTQEECEHIINEYGDKESLVPYFLLYLFDKDKY